jgi:ubiquinone/menaquinone biosynthesis C-methylase UbiE
MPPAWRGVRTPCAKHGAECPPLGAGGSDTLRLAQGTRKRLRLVLNRTATGQTFHRLESPAREPRLPFDSARPPDYRSAGDGTRADRPQRPRGVFRVTGDARLRAPARTGIGRVEGVAGMDARKNRRETDSRPPAAGGRFKRSAADQFDRWAAWYDRSILNELVFFPSIRAVQEELERWQAGRGPAGPFRMLDVGCGTGSLLALAAQDERAGLLVGLDYSAEMVRQAAAKFAAAPRGEKLFVVNGDSERLPLRDASFDVLACCNSFHHYPNQASVVREFRRVLRPGGMLIVVDGFRDNVVGWILFDVIVALAERDVHHASWSQIRSLLAAAGFAHVRQRKVNVLAPLLVTVATV